LPTIRLQGAIELSEQDLVESERVVEKAVDSADSYGCG